MEEKMNLSTHPQNRQNIIHFFGSTQDKYDYGVSLCWMRGAYENLIEREESPLSRLYSHKFLECGLDGTWSFPSSLDDIGIQSAERISFEIVISTINILQPVAAVPHMFCLPGMTTIRGLFEMLGVPVIGNKPESMALSTHKWQTLCLLKAVGVPVAKNELLTKISSEEKVLLPSLTPPFIIKPCSEGNSFGLSLFKGEEGEDLSSKLEDAFKYGNEVLVEQFIHLGYEVRVAVVEDENEKLEVLPICNYKLNESQPIRTLEDKLHTDDDGIPTTLTKCSRELPAVSLPNSVISSIQHYALKAHRAIGSRDYSIFDVRVSPDGTPYFIEASLYCSYASGSIIVMMSEAAGREPFELFNIALTKAIKRKSKKQLMTSKPVQEPMKHPKSDDSVDLVERLSKIETIVGNIEAEIDEKQK